MHNAFDYGAEGILEKGEWNEWKGMIQDIGGHPVMLACLYSGHDRGYMSKEFAAELQNIYSADPRTKAIIESYYSDMLKPEWLSAFKARGD